MDAELTNRTLPRKPRRLRPRRRRLREFTSIPHAMSLMNSDSADAPSTHVPATETSSESKDAPASSHIESHSKEEAEAKPFAPAETESGSEKKEEVTKEQEVAAAASQSGPTEEGEDAAGADAKKAE